MRLVSLVLLSSLCACGSQPVDMPPVETMFVAVPGASELRVGDTPACNVEGNGYLTLLDYSMDYNWAIIDHLYLLPGLADAVRSGDDDSASWSVSDGNVELTFTATRSGDDIDLAGSVGDTEFIAGRTTAGLTSGNWTVRSTTGQATVDITWTDGGELEVSFDAVGTGRSATFRRAADATAEFHVDGQRAAVAQWDDTDTGHIEANDVRSCWCIVEQNYCPTDC